MKLADQIATTLEVLRGIPLLDASRAANMQMFGFGACRTVRSPLGRDKEVAEYALHIQCCWRVRIHDRIWVASRDLNYPKGDWSRVDENFDWDQPGANRCDERMEVFIREHCLILTKDILVDEVGGFRLTFERGCSLEVFPDDSLETEHWRLFKPGDAMPHAVLVGNQFETD